jgi:hypothetical protein
MSNRIPSIFRGFRALRFGQRAATQNASRNVTPKEIPNVTPKVEQESLCARVLGTPSFFPYKFINTGINFGRPWCDYVVERFGKLHRVPSSDMFLTIPFVDKIMEIDYAFFAEQAHKLKEFTDIEYMPELAVVNVSDSSPNAYSWLDESRNDVQITRLHTSLTCLETFSTPFYKNPAAERYKDWGIMISRVDTSTGEPVYVVAVMTLVDTPCS